MSNLKILVWQNRDMVGEPDVEVRIPTSLAKWIPRMMKFIPRKTKEETWGNDVDFNAMLSDLENLVKEAAEAGQPEIMDVKTKDAHIKILVEK